MTKKTLWMGLSSLILLLAAFLMIGFAYGWFASLFTMDGGEISVGDLRYTVAGSFDDTITVFVPGQELLESDITITNNSPIPSQLRVKITYTKITNPSGTPVIESVDYQAGVNDHLSVTMNALFVAVDGYFYYDGTSGLLPNSGALTSLITSISYNGNLAGIDYANEAVTVTITIEGKQADHVSWSELVSYDFSTGYPA